MMKHQFFDLKLNGKKVLLITIVISLFIVLITVTAILFLRPVFEGDLTENTETKHNSEDFESIFDDIDFSALTATVEYRFRSINQGFATDADHDGRKELFFELETEQYSDHRTVFAFENLDNPIMSSVTHFGAAGDASIQIANDGSAILQYGYYALANTSNVIEKWSDSGWENIGSVRGGYENDQFVLDNGSFNGKEFDSFDDYNAELEKLGLKDYPGHYGNLLSNYFATDNGVECAEQYDRYLRRHFADQYHFEQGDFDSDGKDEYIFVVKDFAGKWFRNLTTGGTDGNLMEDYIGSLTNAGTVCIYADTDESGIVFHSFIADNATTVSVDDDTSVYVYWYNCELHVSISDRTSGCDQYYFCASCDLSGKKNRQDDFYTEIRKQYAIYLKKHFCNDVISRCADISDAPGKEMVFVCEKGDPMTILCAFINGRIITFYKQDLDLIGAVYLVKGDGQYLCLLGYYQDIVTISQESSNRYRYQVESFDSCYRSNVLSSETVILSYNETPTQEDKDFFRKLNEYLKEAEICVDSYELTGYSKMQADDSDFTPEESKKYLSISNCSTNKNGTVKVNADSWLNFRKGPSVSYDKILLNPGDPQSFVKQSVGSSVSVIDTVNTTDPDNPVWVKIQIKYSDKTLIGYSAAGYIQMTDILHLSVGKKFKVAASTNDTGLKWSSNDENVLSIDPDSGEAIAKKKGLVSVKVVSDSGLEDSCLIMVD